MLCEQKTIVSHYYHKKAVVIPKYRTVDIAYESCLFEIPPKYIIYNEKDSNFLQDVIELSKKDVEFLESIKCGGNQEEFKTILKDLEERAHIERKMFYERNKDQIAFLIKRKSARRKIFDYWKSERTKNKRSFLRKYWNQNQLEDRFLGYTFNGDDQENTNLLRKKRVVTEPLQIYKSLKETQFEFQIMLEKIICLLKEKEIKKLEALKIDILNFELVKSILFQRRPPKQQIEDKVAYFEKIEENSEKFDEIIENLETNESIDEEYKKETKKKEGKRHYNTKNRLKKQFEAKVTQQVELKPENTPTEREETKKIVINKGPISISAKYIKDIVSKKLSSTGQDSGPIRKKYIFKKENEVKREKEIPRANIEREIPKGNLEKELSTKGKVDDEDECLIEIEKELVQNFISSRSAKTTFDSLKKKLEENYSLEEDKCQTVFLGKKYKWSKSLDEISKIPQQNLREWRKRIMKYF
jgi:hypothetical protein